MARKPQMAEITIGGNLPAALLEQFLGELDSTGARVGKHDGEKFGAKTVEQLRQALDESGHLLLVADKFDELECFCVAHDIAFDVRSTTRSLYFRPGMKRPESSDKSSDALLDTGNIRPVAKELAGLVTVALTREKVLAAAVKVIRHLNALLPPELLPLEIEEE